MSSSLLQEISSIERRIDKNTLSGTWRKQVEHKESWYGFLAYFWQTPLASGYVEVYQSNKMMNHKYVSNASRLLRMIRPSEGVNVHKGYLTSLVFKTFRLLNYIDLKSILRIVVPTRLGRLLKKNYEQQRPYYSRLRHLVSQLGLEKHFDQLPPAKRIGGRFYYRFGNYEVDFNSVKYLTQYLTLQRYINISSSIKSVLEIGGGYGGFAEQVLHHNSIPYYIIDIESSLVVSYYYLSQAFPEKKLVLHLDRFDEKSTGDIHFISSKLAKSIKNQQWDLVVNSESFSEMPSSVSNEYFSLIQENNRVSYFYNYNREWRKEGDEIIHFDDYPYDSEWVNLLDTDCEYDSVHGVKFYSKIRQRISSRVS